MNHNSSGSSGVSEKLALDVQTYSGKLEKAMGEMAKVVVGQKHVCQRIFMAIIARGHILLEGLPGLAKTTSIKTAAQIMDLDFRRIQFTPDLLPADLIGTQIFDPRQTEFRTKKGPLFTNLLLADEINRAPAKVQSALLEAMGERQVTLADKTYALDEPFMVMATQNPIEQEGTYPLPEAQVDRFMFKVNVGYGSVEDEREIIRRLVNPEPVKLTAILEKPDLLALQGLVPQVHVEDAIYKYIVDLVFATRDPKKYGLKDIGSFLEFGASPRASIFLERAARVNAIFAGRAYVTPQDVKDVGVDILAHRLHLSFEAEAEGVTSTKIVKQVFDQIDVP